MSRGTGHCEYSFQPAGIGPGIVAVTTRLPRMSVQMLPRDKTRGLKKVPAFCHASYVSSVNKRGCTGRGIHGGRDVYQRNTLTSVTPCAKAARFTEKRGGGAKVDAEEIRERPLAR